MKKITKKILIGSGILLGLVLAPVLVVIINFSMEQSQMVFGRPHYDIVQPVLPDEIISNAILVFSKTNAYRHDDAIIAGRQFFTQLARIHDYQLYLTENGAVFNRRHLRRFALVIWNNVTGPALRPEQRIAFKNYLERGGGFLAIHGSGGRSHRHWKWYTDEVIRARFIGSPVFPRFQRATLVNQAHRNELMYGLPSRWRLKDEWLSFDSSPRERGSTILAVVEDIKYDFYGQKMVGEHPMAWAHEVGEGRVAYLANGHRPELFANIRYMTLLENAVRWAGRFENN